MIEMLKKIFESNPEKSTIVLKGICLDCGRDVTINITPTSGGFGLQGGALLGCSSDGYFTKCPNCYNINNRIEHLHKPKCVHAQ
jgi:hypothetical protein